MSLIVSGIRCTWFGPSEKLSASGSCLHCAGPVSAPFDEDRWWAEVDAVEQGTYPWPKYKKVAPELDWKPRPHPGYRAMWVWAQSQNRCFKHIAHLRNSYLKHTAIVVDLEP